MSITILVEIQIQGVLEWRTLQRPMALYLGIISDALNMMHGVQYRVNHAWCAMFLCIPLQNPMYDIPEEEEEEEGEEQEQEQELK